MIFIPLCQLSLKSSLFSKRRLGQDPTNAKGRLKPPYSVFRRPFPISDLYLLWLHERCHPKKKIPETDCPKPTGAMRSTICCICPLPKPSATTTTSTATVPPPSCPTADKSTTCITVAAICTKSASTTKSSPTSNAIGCTVKSTALRVNSPAVTNSIS